jgi:positive regulator of sigma E activity
VFSLLFSRQAAEIALPNCQDFVPGQIVRVGIRSHDVVKLAIIVYLLPVLAFILGAALAASLLVDSLAQDLFGLAAGLAAACVAAYLGSRYGRGVLNPHLEMLSASARCAAFEGSATAD